MSCLSIVARTKKGTKLNNAVVFELKIEPKATMSSGAMAKVYIRNVSKHSQRLLLSQEMQFPKPILTKESGQAVELEDSNMNSKFDRTPYQSLFEVLTPGQELEVGTVTIEPYESDSGEGGFVFRFGSFKSFGLNDNAYNLQLKFESRVQGWNLDETQVWQQKNDIWIGIVESKKIHLKIKAL